MVNYTEEIEKMARGVNEGKYRVREREGVIDIYDNRGNFVGVIVGDEAINYFKKLTEGGRTGASAIWIDRIEVVEEGTAENPYPCAIVYARDYIKGKYYRVKLCGYECDDLESGIRDALKEIMRVYGERFEELSKDEYFGEQGYEY